MKKIVSLFARNYDGDRLVRDEVVPGAEWVVAGDGLATRKWDGTCCRVQAGVLWKRYDRKAGKPAPEGWEAAQEPDPVTGHWPGWLPVSPTDAADRWHREAWDRQPGLPDGTYELIGPKVQGNPEGAPDHRLVPHGGLVLEPDPPRTYVGLRTYLDGGGIEGIVWHHPDGRMVKIKAKDFGVRR